MIPSHKIRTRTPVVGPLYVIVAIVSALLLVGMNYLVKEQVTHSSHTEAALTRNADFLYALHNLVLQNARLSSSSRGFALTGAEEYVPPFERAFALNRTSFDMVAASTPPEWRNRPELAELRALQDQRVAWSMTLRRYLQARDNVGLSAAVRTRNGERMLARLIAIVDTIEYDAGSQRRLLLTQNDHDQRTVRLLVIVLTGVTTLLLIVATITAIRGFSGRQSALDAAVRARRRFESIFENASDAILLLDERAIIGAANRSAEKMLLRSRADLVGASADILFADKAQFAALRRMGRDKQTNRPLVRRLGCVRSDRERFEAELALTMFIDKATGQRNYVALLRDVTEQQRLERLKSDFVSTVSHELRTPLTSIAGSLGLLEGGIAGELNAGGQKLVSIARNNCGRLIRLINDILDIEKLEAGKLRFRLRRIALRPIIERAVDEIRPYGVPLGISYKIAAVPEGATVSADEDRLLQIFANLLSNATKFSPKGKTVTIAVSENGPDKWTLSVTDRGPGIPEEFRSRIFSKFAQADGSASRAQGGTGLGLAIVRQLAEGMGGTIGFTSVPFRATTFNLTLDRAAPISPTDSGVTTGADTLPGILHVDGDEDTLNILAESFAGKGSVTSCSSLAAARQAIASRNFEAAIIDVDLPDGKGPMLIADLKARNADIKIIAFTAYDSDFDDHGVADMVVTKSKADLERLTGQVMAAVAAPETNNVVSTGARAWRYD